MPDAVELQRTDEWWRERRGRITSSIVHRIVNGTPDGWRSLMSQLARERQMESRPTEMTGRVRALEHGETMEPAMLASAMLTYQIEITPVGFVRHPTIEYIGASSDGLVLRPGKPPINVEGKCPLNSEIHRTTVMTRRLPERYKPQVQLQMAVHDTDLTYFVSHHEKMPHWKWRTVMVEVVRDQDYIDYMLELCERFWRLYTFQELPRVAGLPRTF